MKTIMIFGTAVIIAFGVVACQGDNDSPKQDKTTTPHSVDKDR
ncbi:MAG: hypothetical protein QM666_10855 [Acinetobacter sp.]